mmetsp:Transcript_62836/g.101275  ORF Transcript_62836/g.101275 Transcript_62836/m.101275 type:complete len:143 (-) Transcript_62836:27-455(-)
MSLRESIFVMGMFGLTPMVTERLMKKFKGKQNGEMLSKLIGSAISGVIASVITHPIDTLKTCLQADMYGEVYQNIVQALFKLIREQGFASLFQGILPRTCMCILAFFVTTTLKAKSEQYKFVLQQREQRRKRKQSATLAIQG